MEEIGTGRVSFDFKHVFSSVIKDNFNSEGDGNSKMEELASKAEENETLDGYILGNLSTLFFLHLGQHQY